MHVRPGQGPTSANPLRICTVTVVFCGMEVSLLLPATLVPRWVPHLPSGPPHHRLLRRHPRVRSLLVPAGRSGPESKLGGNQSFCSGFAPHHFLPPRTGTLQASIPQPATFPMSSLLQQHRPYLPRRPGKVSFPFLPGEPVATILSPLLGRLASQN